MSENRFRYGGRLSDDPTPDELAEFIEANRAATARQRADDAWRHSGILEHHQAEAERMGLSVPDYIERVVRPAERFQFALAHMYDEYEVAKRAQQKAECQRLAAYGGGTPEREGFLRAELDRQARLATTIAYKHASLVDYEVLAAPVPFNLKLLAGSEGRFRGYAATWQQDLTGDIIDRGAFTDTLAAARTKGGRVLFPVLFSHDASLPIGGVVEAREDATGLAVEGLLDLDTGHGREAYSVLQKRFVSGLSIGYRVVRSRTDRDGTRHLAAINLMEVSVVVFPANPAAGVTSLG